MTAIIRTNFRQVSARNFIEYTAQNAANSLYAFIGRVRPWTNEQNPPTPANNFAEDRVKWEEMFALKRVSSGDVSYVVPRYNWVSGATNFVAWSDADSDIFDKRFFCINTELRVYKLVVKGAGATTVMPSGDSSTNNYVQELSDGYKWKFMYQVGPVSALKFLSTDWVPVKTLLVTDGTTQWTVQQTGNNTPYAGHGIDPVRELGGYATMVNARFEYGEGGTFTTQNEFRVIGLVLNPQLYGTTTIATATTYKQSRVLTLSGVTGTFAGDETIQSTNGSQAMVIEFSGTTLAYVTSSTLTAGAGFTAGQTLTGLTSGATATISVVGNPALKANSGNILYIDNRRAISRDASQTEDMKCVVVF